MVKAAKRAHIIRDFLIRNYPFCHRLLVYDGILYSRKHLYLPGFLKGIDLFILYCGHNVPYI